MRLQRGRPMATTGPWSLAVLICPNLPAPVSRTHVLAGISCVLTESDLTGADRSCALACKHQICGRSGNRPPSPAQCCPSITAYTSGKGPGRQRQRAMSSAGKRKEVRSCGPESWRKWVSSGRLKLEERMLSNVTYHAPTVLLSRARGWGPWGWAPMVDGLAGKIEDPDAVGLFR